MPLFAIRQSNTWVKVYFDPQIMQVTSAKYTMSIRYEDIASAELAAAGEKVADGYDDDTLRAGVWTNDTWGEYITVADPDATNCIKLTLNDGRILVFSRKNNDSTAEDFVELQDFLK